jgi:hypothetical protein
MEYTIVNAGSLAILQKNMNDLIRVGGEPVGGIGINTKTGEGFFFQAAMVPEGILNNNSANTRKNRKSKKSRKLRKL